MPSGHAEAMSESGVYPVPRGRGDTPRRGAVLSPGDRLAALLAARSEILAASALLALAVGGALLAVGASAAGRSVWTVAVGVLALELSVEVLRSLFVERSLGVDTIALVAMVGALALGEDLTGLVIGLMFSGGGSLEHLASARARRELTALVERAPKFARLRVGGELREVAVGEIGVGDVVLVRTGETVPVDGTMISDEAVLDTSTLTGESLPLSLVRGMPVLSGTANAGPPFDVRADRPAVESAYSALVRLVEQAQAQRAPFVRMADRYAGFFLPLTIVVAGLAWILSGESERALAVVVVATPCPLILAAPIALVAGLSRAAQHGVIVKGAGAIETLGLARTVLFDKTGTLTVGTPAVREVLVRGNLDEPEILRLAASVDQYSAHVLGAALVTEAHGLGLVLSQPTDVVEEPGQGIAGTVSGHRVLVGSRAFLLHSGVPAAELSGARAATTRGSGEAHVMVAVDGRLGGLIVMADELRPDAAGLVGRLKTEGIRHVAMLSGDRRSVADRIGGQLAIDRVYAELAPEAKLAVVQSIGRDPELTPVIMVGDGINDAPALAAAELGIAIGAAGATISSETADAVITVNRVDTVVDAVRIGRRSLGIARQSVIVGMGLSMAAMAVAAAGYLPPIGGALLQEGIDLAVILNALRALRE